MNNSSTMMPVYMMLWMNCIMLPMLLLDDQTHTEKDVIHAMTAETPEQAEERGMKESLKPYFTECQKDAGITSGVSEGVTYDMANNVILCMEDKKENDDKPKLAP